MTIRFFCALLFGKVAFFFLRLVGRGGTAAPGLVAETIDPKFLSHARGLFQHIILITGTNGKTTTAALVGSILSHTKSSYLHNASGSNMRRGIISTILSSRRMRNNAGKPSFTFGVFECDEAALPAIAQELRPDILAFNNLFRDQLDRYGEVDAVRKKWQALMRALPRTTHIILNADDPGVASLAAAAPDAQHISYFGLCAEAFAAYAADNATHATASLADFSRCPQCGGALPYAHHSFAHLGEYHCAQCGFHRPTPQLCATDIVQHDHRMSFVLRDADQSAAIHLPMIGVYNSYNFLSAASIARVAGFSLSAIQAAADAFKPVFGRQEEIDYHGKRLIITLVKNPVGFSQALAAFSQDQSAHDLIFMLNDNIADGTDVSWIWDADLSALRGRLVNIAIGGTRKEDLAVRLKYEEVGDPKRYVLCDSFAAVLDCAAHAPSGDVLIFPTYTALIGLKNHLGTIGYDQFWQ